MKSYRKELWLNIPGRRGFVNITPQVEGRARKSGIREGLCLVNAMHITATVFINDDESGPAVRIRRVARESCARTSRRARYRHNRTGEDNGDAHRLHHDYEDWLEKLAPHEPVSGYRHNRTGEDNADAHLKRQVMGREVVVAITDGKLDFGPWEQIFYGEFDGGRRKRVLVKIIGE